MQAFLDIYRRVPTIWPGSQQHADRHDSHTHSLEGRTRKIVRNKHSSANERDKQADTTTCAHTRYGQVQGAPLICTLSEAEQDVHQLQDEMEQIRAIPQGHTWITPEQHERRQKRILKALFPTHTDNPWTDLPVHPRTSERAQDEQQVFIANATIGNEEDEYVHTKRHVSHPKLKHTHEAVRNRLLLQKQRAMGHPSKRVMKHMLAQSPSKSDVDLASKVRQFMPHWKECMFGKPKENPRPKKASGHTKATQRLFIDCSEPQSVATAQ